MFVADRRGRPVPSPCANGSLGRREVNELFRGLTGRLTLAGAASPRAAGCGPGPS